MCVGLKKKKHAQRLLINLANKMAFMRFMLASVVVVLASVDYIHASCCQGMAMNNLGLQLTENSEGYVDHVYTDATGVSRKMDDII